MKGEVWTIKRESIADGAEYVMATITGQSGPATSVYVSLKHDEKRIVGIERSFADGKYARATVAHGGGWFPKNSPLVFERTED